MEEKSLAKVDSTKAITFVQAIEPADLLKCDVWLTVCIEFINYCSLMQLLIFKS
jgi:hypothetical protein